MDYLTNPLPTPIIHSLPPMGHRKKINIVLNACKRHYADFRTIQWQCEVPVKFFIVNPISFWAIAISLQGHGSESLQGSRVHGCESLQGTPVHGSESLQGTRVHGCKSLQLRVPTYLVKSCRTTIWGPQINFLLQNYTWWQVLNSMHIFCTHPEQPPNMYSTICVFLKLLFS